MRLYLLAIIALATIGSVRGQEATPQKREAGFIRYRFYAGAAVAAQVYEVVSPRGNIRYLDRVGVYPVYAFGGYQLNPYLGVQAGFCQYAPKDENYQGMGTLPDGRQHEGYDRRRQYDAAVPVLLRYRINRKLSHRFHVDALLGGAVQFHRFRREMQQKVDGQVISYYFQNDRNTNFHLTGGLALGLTLFRRFDLLAEASANTNIETFRYAEVRKFLPALGFGVRYTFGEIR